ncbi:MAG: hypothetical protein QOJ16_4182 [Acidobacteriota bacterium]|nr:hypothetical protein [Acidobacteriota bacterium]
MATAYSRVVQGVPHIGEDTATARRRVFGAPYVEAIEGIRRALPPGFVYVLINADDQDDGFPLWVRHDLAPHRAIYLGRLSELPPNVRRAFPHGGQPVVLTYSYKEPPRLISRQEFLDWFETPGRTGSPEKPAKPEPPENDAAGSPR